MQHSAERYTGMPLHTSSSLILVKSRATSLPLSLKYLEKRECELTSMSSDWLYLTVAEGTRCHKV